MHWHNCRKHWEIIKISGLPERASCDEYILQKQQFDDCCFFYDEAIMFYNSLASLRPSGEGKWVRFYLNSIACLAALNAGTTDASKAIVAAVPATSIKSVATNFTGK